MWLTQLNKRVRFGNEVLDTLSIDERMKVRRKFRNALNQDRLRAVIATIAFILFLALSIGILF